MAEYDFRRNAAELLAEASAQMAAALPTSTAGAERLVDLLLTADDDAVLRGRLFTMGEEIARSVSLFLEAVGESRLSHDAACVGLVACAALTLAHEERPGGDPV